jgi:hypothetical protein
MRIRRPPTLPLPPRRHVAPAPQPGYGVGYRPDWPSILSVAHDTADGASLFVITDRPCVLVPPAPAAQLPLAAGGRAALAAVEILSVKFRLVMTAAVPAGSAWTWAAGAAALVDAVTGHAPNPATGFCADIPGPVPPAGLATVVAASVSADGLTCTFVFDRPLTLIGSPPYEMDGAIELAGLSPIDVAQENPKTLAFAMGSPVDASLPWEIHSQPPWLATPVATPQAGTLA